MNVEFPTRLEIRIVDIKVNKCGTKEKSLNTKFKLSTAA